MKKLSGICFIFTMMVLTACSHITNTVGLQSRDKEYLSAKNEPAIRIPPGLSSDKFDTYYKVSDSHDSEAAKQVTLLPPGLADKTSA